MDAPSFMIYGLVDPRTKLVRYVGCSSQGLDRPQDHGKPWTLAKDRTYKANWIRSLQAAGHTYEIAVLAASTKETLKSDEVWWIAYGRASGWPLTNLTDGGDGTLGWVPPPEFRAKISARFKGRVFTPEHLEKIAAKNRGRKASPEAIERLRQAHLGKPVSPEARAKMSATHRATNAAQKAALPRPAIRINLRGSFDVRPTRKPSPPVSEETRVKMSAAKLGRKQPPEVIAKRVALLTGLKRTPEQRAALSAAQKARFADITHCPQGHEYTAANTRIKPGRTTRECRQCGRDYDKRKKMLERLSKLLRAWEGI